MREWLKKFLPNRQRASEAGKAALAALGAGLKSLPGSMISACLPILILMLASPAGAYLNNYLFYNPAMRLRHILKLQATLDPSITPILFEDRSLEKLQRAPTMAEMYEIAGLLFDSGVDTVLALGTQDVDIPAGMPHHTRGRFIIGAAMITSRENLRAQPTAAIPPSLLLPLDDGGAGFHRADFYLGPDAASLAYVDGLGVMNLAKDNAMDLAFNTGQGGGLANLGLMARPSLSLAGGRLHFGTEAPPLAVRGQDVYINYVDTGSVYDAALPMSAFYNVETHKVVKRLSTKLAARLKSCKTALLIAEAFTGSRFVDGPNGKVPSFMTVLSIANSAVTRAYTGEPVNSGLVQVLSLALLIALLSRRAAKAALATAGVALTALLASFIGLFFAVGWIFPVIPLAVTAAVAFTVRHAHHLLAAFAEKMRLAHDLEMGRTVQSYLLPANLSAALDDWDYKIIYAPYGAMAGDWVQVFTGDGAEAMALLAIGDVVGKGPSAALNTALIAGAWNNYVPTWNAGDLASVDEFILRLDESIRRTFKDQQPTTLSLAVLLKDRIRLTACCAPRWLRYDAQTGKMATVATKRSNPLGGPFPHTDAPSWAEIPAQPGDVFVAYTDGVIDGLRGVSAFCRKADALGLGEAATDEVFARIEREARAAGQNDVLPDDFTLLMVRRKVPEAVAKTA